MMLVQMDYMFVEFGNSIKCYMTIQVDYEPKNLNDETHKGFDAYLSVSPIRIFKKFGIVTKCGNPYRFKIGILTERFKEVNSKFIRDKS